MLERLFYYKKNVDNSLDHIFMGDIIAESSMSWATLCDKPEVRDFAGFLNELLLLRIAQLSLDDCDNN